VAWFAWLTLQIWQLHYLVSQEQSHILHPLLACHLQIAMARLLPTSADPCSSTQAGLSWTPNSQKWGTISDERQKARKQRADVHGKSQAARSKGQGLGCDKTRATTKKHAASYFGHTSEVPANQYVSTNRYVLKVLKGNWDPTDKQSTSVNSYRQNLLPACKVALIH